jgi:hypothetical protein
MPGQGGPGMLRLGASFVIVGDHGSLLVADLRFASGPTCGRVTPASLSGGMDRTRHPADLGLNYLLHALSGQTGGQRG